jgi:hypothetical protein
VNPHLLADDAVLHRALKDYIERGFLLLHGTPTQADSILTIARRFGFVRETNFGVFFEVCSRPDSTDLAYRPVALGPHTDNPYRNPVPGIQLLHCLQNETSGGLSTRGRKKSDSKGYLRRMAGQCDIAMRSPRHGTTQQSGKQRVERIGRRRVKTGLAGGKHEVCRPAQQLAWQLLQPGATKLPFQGA